ncbi:MAG: DUF72 domain-containing protein [Anaerolineales bacterium]|nr:DUF72 domain-containing protein [Anaerolineales bacterium]
MIRLGTSGFSYDDWVGPVYPVGLPRRGWLGHYAQQFDTVELNVTYYRLPASKTVEGWVAHTPADFLFTVKAHGSLTHERQAPDFAGFVLSAQPLKESGKLACVLAQFPHAFHPTPDNREYLARLREGLGELPVVIEFRDSAWVSEATFERLRQLDLGYCCVDEPALKGLMPPVAVATSSLGYVRFHGRNAARWWEHEQAFERYDYTYRRDELEEWVPRLRDLEANTSLTLVYANNHYRGQSVDALRQLSLLLADGSR